MSGRFLLRREETTLFLNQRTMDLRFRQDMVFEWEDVSPSVDCPDETEKVSSVLVSWLMTWQEKEDELETCNVSSNQVNMCSFLEI